MFRPIAYLPPLTHDGRDPSNGMHDLMGATEVDTSLTMPAIGSTLEDATEVSRLSEELSMGPSRDHWTISAIKPGNDSIHSTHAGIESSVERGVLVDTTNTHRDRIGKDEARACAGMSPQWRQLKTGFRDTATMAPLSRHADGHSGQTPSLSAFVHLSNPVQEDNVDGVPLPTSPTRKEHNYIADIAVTPSKAYRYTTSAAVDEGDFWPSVIEKEVDTDQMSELQAHSVARRESLTRNPIRQCHQWSGNILGPSRSRLLTPKSYYASPSRLGLYDRWPALKSQGKPQRTHSCLQLHPRKDKEFAPNIRRRHSELLSQTSPHAGAAEELSNECPNYDIPSDLTVEEDNGPSKKPETSYKDDRKMIQSRLERTNVSATRPSDHVVSVEKLPAEVRDLYWPEQGRVNGFAHAIAGTETANIASTEAQYYNRVLTVTPGEGYMIRRVKNNESGDDAAQTNDKPVLRNMPTLRDKSSFSDHHFKKGNASADTESMEDEDGSFGDIPGFAYRRRIASTSRRSPYLVSFTRSQGRDSGRPQIQPGWSEVRHVKHNRGGKFKTSLSDIYVNKGKESESLAIEYYEDSRYQRKRRFSQSASLPSSESDTLGYGVRSKSTKRSKSGNAVGKSKSRIPGTYSEIRLRNVKHRNARRPSPENAFYRQPSTAGASNGGIGRCSRQYPYPRGSQPVSSFDISASRQQRDSLASNRSRPSRQSVRQRIDRLVASERIGYQRVKVEPEDQHDTSKTAEEAVKMDTQREAEQGTLGRREYDYQNGAEIKRSSRIRAKSRVKEAEALPQRHSPMLPAEQASTRPVTSSSTRKRYPRSTQSRDRLIECEKTLPELLPRLYMQRTIQERPTRKDGRSAKEPMSEDDLYTARWLKGTGMEKLALCPLCPRDEPEKWYRTKVSAYWYHMNFYHGVSPANGRPYAAPLAIRRIDRGSSQNTERPPSGPKGLTNREKFYQGQCGKCNKWVDLEGTKDVDVVVLELYWWKHAQHCHGRGDAYKASNNRLES